MPDIFNDKFKPNNLTSPQDSSQKELSKNYNFDLGLAFYQSKRFKKGYPYLQVAIKEALERKDSEQYFLCYSILMRIFTEMHEIEEIESLHANFKEHVKILSVEKTSKVLVREANYFICLKQISKDESKDQDNQIFTLLTEALNGIFDRDKANSKQDQLENIYIKLDFIDCLQSFALFHLEKKDYKKAHKDVENLKVLIDYYFNFMDELVLNKSKTDDMEKQREYHNLLQIMNKHSSYAQEAKLNVKKMEALQSLINENDFNKAEKILWECYEIANKIDGGYYIPYILMYMAYAHNVINDVEQAELFLNLAEKHAGQDYKLLITYIENFKAKTGLGQGSKTGGYDLVFNEYEHSLVEKQKGCVNFKNQFILLEMLKLFILNQGEPYSKKLIVEKVWKQDYSPSTHDNKIYVTIKRLRELIEPDISKPQYICRNSRGYYLDERIKILIKGGQNE